LDLAPSLRSRSGFDETEETDREMRKEKSEVRKKMVVVRMNESEHASLENLYKKSTCRNLSEYLRKVGLQQPVTIKIRNQSADDLLQEFIRLKNELNAIGNNFNQAVHKLHTLDRIPEFRIWLNHYESTRSSLHEQFTTITKRLNQIYLQWSPE
jgi:hypothetical protein